MGIEYQVKLKQPFHTLIDKTLRDCPFFDGYDETYDQYSFRWGESKSPEMPAAFAAIRSYGLYICLNAGRKNSDEFVGYIRALVVNKLGEPFDIDEI